MRKQVKLLSMMLTAALLIAGCTKDPTDDSSATGATGKMISQVLRAEIEYDETDVDGLELRLPGYCDYSQMTLEYKDSKLIRIVDVDNEDADDNMYYMITYDGDHIKQITATGDDADEVQISFSYTGNQLTKVRMFESTEVTFTYYSDGKLASMVTPTELDEETTWQYTWEGDNVKRVDIIANGRVGYTFSFTYDDKLSPYYGMDLAAQWVLNLFGMGTSATLDGSYAPIPSKNNVRTCVKNNSEKSTYTYQYDGDYPVSGTLREENEDGELGRRETVVYYRYADGTGSIPKFYTITTSISNEEMGSRVVPDFGEDGQQFPQGTELTVYCHCNEYYYHLSHWSDGSTQNPYTFKLNANTDLTAIVEAVN